VEVWRGGREECECEEGVLWLLFRELTCLFSVLDLVPHEGAGTEGETLIGCTLCN